MFTRKTRSQQPTEPAPNSGKTAMQLKDRRPETGRDIQLQQLAASSPQIRQTTQLQASADQYTAQLKTPEKENRTGLPDHLKAGIENLSGYNMDDVKVHYNSSKPAHLQAHAYAQGSDIHMAPGQEKHLPHEAWHVVQQKQGRVKPTIQLKKGVAVNDDNGLEKEADEMGTKALASGGKKTTQRKSASAGTGIVQCYRQIRFANLKQTEDKYAQKASDIIDVLQQTPIVMAFLADKNMLIVLRNNKDSTTPASVHVEGEQALVNLSPWFFEQESRGKIIGMLAHELGVHPIGDELLTKEERGVEKYVAKKRIPIPTNFYPRDTIVSDKDNQDDHLFAAVEGTPRFDIYRRTVFELGNAMLNCQGVAHNITDNHVTDLILSYLADISTILSTSDHRGLLMDKDRAAEYFNFVRGKWLDFLDDQEDQRLIALTPPPQTGNDVKRKIGSLIGSKLLGIFTNSVDDFKSEQQQKMNGNFRALTTNQREILDDFDHLEQKRAFNRDAPQLLETIDALTGKARDTTAKRLKNRLHNLDRTTLSAKTIEAATDLAAQLDKDWDVLQPNADIMHLVATLLGSKIRIIRANGIIESWGTEGDYLTLLEIAKPEHHYRGAVPR
jgi:hypothetical protein